MKHLKYFKKILEELENRSIPNILKDISEIIYNQIKDKSIPLSINYNLDVLKFNLSIIQNNDNTYYSSIDVLKIIENPLNPIDIIVKVPNDYDIHYVLATIIHETRHVYDLIEINSESDMQSFIKDIHIRKYKIGYYTEFINLIYLSLEHELVARNNMIYPYIKFKEIDIEQSKNIIKSSFIYKSLEYLNNFNSLEFINKFNLNELIKITNDFNLNVLNQNEHLNTKDDILIFYKNFEEFFKETSKTCKEELNSEVNKVYENKMILFETKTNSSKVKDILVNLYNNKIKTHD